MKVNPFYFEMVTLISDLKKIDSMQLRQDPKLSSHELDMVDVVDIILEVEKKYNLIITDDMPADTINDFVQIVEQGRHGLAP